LHVCLFQYPAACTASIRSLHPQDLPQSKTSPLTEGHS
jgi:hypothetical protein